MRLYVFCDETPEPRRLMALLCRLIGHKLSRGPDNAVYVHDRDENLVGVLCERCDSWIGEP